MHLRNLFVPGSRSNGLIVVIGWLALAAWSGGSASGQTVLHVNAAAAPGGNGTSWATAYNSLQAAINAVGSTGAQQIWVAAGVYKPTFQFNGSGPQAATFLPENNVAIMGGFSGNETMASQRDPWSNQTTLSGDIGVVGDPSDNVWHVVTAVSGHNPTAVLDGFTVTDGRATAIEDRGAGMHLTGSPTIRNCRIMNNVASWQGAGVYATANISFTDCEFINNTGSIQGAGALHAGGLITLTRCLFEANSGQTGAVRGSGTFTDCTFVNNFSGAVAGTGTLLRCSFVGNSASGTGGAVTASGGSLLRLIDCTFQDNDANEGGAVYAASSTFRATNCTFFGNASVSRGGAIRCSENSAIINCIFSGNQSATGGAVYFSPGSSLTIKNCTLANNTASLQGGGVRSDGGQNVIANSIFWGNATAGVTNQAAQVSASGTLQVNNCCVQGFSGSWGGAGNIATDPMFINAQGPDFLVGTEDDDVRLLPGSPCIDAGNNAVVPLDVDDLDGDGDTTEVLPLDILGNARFFDDRDTTDTGAGISPIVDLGATEFDGFVEPLGPGVYVGPVGGSWFDPANWAGNVVPNPKTTVFIPTEVLVDAQANALGIIVMSAGSLLVEGGSIEVASGVIVEAGGLLRLSGANPSVTATVCAINAKATLSLTSSSALLDLQSLTIFSKATLDWTAGVIRITAGVFSAGEPVQIGCVGVAELQIFNGGSCVAPLIELCASGTLSGPANVNSNILNGGSVSPGVLGGVMQITGSYTQSDQGLLNIDMAGYLPGTGYARLDVTGTTTVGGTLSILALPGFEPALGGDQRVVVAPNIAGTFDQVNLPSLDDGFEMTIGYNVPMPDLQSGSVKLQTTLQTTGPRLYVNQAAVLGGNGQSWKNAANDLAGALTFAALFPNDVEEIWVAAGTYAPDRGTGDRFSAFVIRPGLAVYGGFAGSETSLAERDWLINETVLSGDLLEDDGPPGSFQNNSENSYNVVRMTCISCPTPPRLDGFTITGGNANAGAVFTVNRRGGGIYASGTGAVIANCRILHNHALNRGGGIALHSSNALISDSQFIGNTCDVHGGGLGIGDGTGPTVQITSCDFESNSAGSGGASWIPGASAIVFDGCVFTDNDGAGAAVRLEAMSGNAAATFNNCQFYQNGLNSGVDAIVHLQNNSCSVTANNCTFQDNFRLAIRGGLMTLDSCSFIDNLGGALGGVGDIVAADCTFMGNSDPFGGGAVSVSGGNSLLTNCVFTNNQGATGGAIRLSLGGSPQMTLDACVFEQNQATVGSAIYVEKLAKLRGNAVLMGDQELYLAGALMPSSSGSQIGSFSMTGGTFRQANPSDDALESQLHIDLGGPIAGIDHDHIQANHAIMSGGLLQVNLLNDFSPRLGEQFTIINTPNLTGGFAVASMPALDDGRYLTINNSSSGLSFSVEELAALLTFIEAAGVPLDGVPFAATAADLNADGWPELIMTFGSQTTPGSIVAFRNAGVDGSGNWNGFVAAPVTIQVGIRPQALAVGYFNSDSIPDVAAANNGSSSVSVLMGTGDNTLVALANTYTVGGFPVSIAAGPGANANLAVGCLQFNNVWNLNNNGSGGFAVGQIIGGTRQPTAVALADVNNDGASDLVAARTNVGDLINTTQVEVRLYDAGQQLFGQVATYNVGRGVTQMEVADLNGSGYADVITVDAAQATLSILLNQDNGNGTFGPTAVLPIGDQPKSLVVADLDQDNDPDLLIITNDLVGQPVARIVRNDLTDQGQLIFATASDLGIGMAPLLGSSADFNGNGSNDLLLVTSASGSLAGSSITAQVLLNATQLVECPGDIVADQVVNVDDLLLLLASWGPCAKCPADLAPSGGDNQVNVDDLLVLLAAWGPCR